MADVKLKLPDGSEKKLKQGITALEIAKGIGEGLARASIAAKLNGNLIDLDRPITENGDFQIITQKDEEAIEVLRHSTAHVMAEAVVSIFPYAKPTIGPVVEEGFYYDFDHEPFKPEDLEKIEKRMQEIISKKLSFERQELKKAEAVKLFKDNKFKIELVNEFSEEGQTISIYKQGEFADLCRGPHLPDTGKIKAFKITKLAAAYWKGDAKNPQLQRIYGISFFDKKDLKKYIELREEAEKRDHRKIGKQLDLFSFHEEAPGMPYIHAKGMVIWNELINFWRKLHTEDGYVEVKTPIMMNKNLWVKSGHWDNYRENMYLTKVDDVDYAIKPMNCPGGILVYKEHLHSYREFPIKAGEIGLVHRHELSGVIGGMMRVRSFHQDDAHIYMIPEQIEEQIIGVIRLTDKIYKAFGLDYKVELSTRPEKSIGTDEQWKTATAGLKGALDKSGLKYEINEGDGAFYGPKIDFHIRDSIGRTWQCATIQLDMALPERFDLTFEGQDGHRHRPVMIHRTIYGAIERFMGILIEHYAGKFPLWLNPVQVKLLPITDRHMEYTEKVRKQFFDAGMRVEIDTRTESINKKVRDAQLAYVNYILVIGDKEQENSTVNVRTRDNKVHGEKKADAFLKELLKEVEERK
ncbi:threonine--tRNA ligase [Thermoproteota archaeon]